MKISSDYFVPLALRRLATGSSDEIKEAVELLIFYRELYRIPRATRLMISAQLVALLSHPDDTIRYWTARALGEYRCPEALPFMKKALASEKNLSVRGWLQGAIAHISGVSIDHLRSDVYSSSAETRSLAAQALFFNPSPEARSLIASSMQEDDRSVLAWKLLALPGPRHMRSRAALLDPLGTPILPSYASDELQEDLLRSLIGLGDDQVTEYSIWNASLGRIGGLAGVIRRLAEPGGHDNPRVREWAYKFLGFLPSKEDLPLLAAMRDIESDPKARQGIAFAVGNIGGPESLDLLADMIRNDPEDDVKRWAARAMACRAIPWPDAEQVLIDALEINNSVGVHGEALGTLELRDSTALLRKLPLLEARAEHNQGAVISLLLAIASNRMDLSAKARLTRLLEQFKAQSSEVVGIAHVMAENYDIASKLIAFPQYWSSEVEIYRNGLKRLFQAAALAHDDPVRAEESLRDALFLLRRLRKLLSRVDPDEAGLAREVNPLTRYSEFYEELCISLLKSLEGIEDRLRGNFGRSRDNFEKALRFYRLHELDKALPVTERNLCSAVKLWLQVQCELTAFSAGERFDQERWLILKNNLFGSKLRAKDAQRIRVFEQLEGLEALLADIMEEGPGRMFERWTAVNRHLLTVPILLDAPFSATAAATVEAREVKSTVRGLTVTFAVNTDQASLDDLGEPFDLVVVIELGSRCEEHLLMQSGRINSGASLTCSIEIEAEKFSDDVAQIVAQPILRFGFLDWLCGAPITIDIQGEGPYGDVNQARRKLIGLREAIARRFDQEELRTLCHDLGIDYDDLRGEGKTAKIRELLLRLEKNGRLEELREAVESTITKH